MRYIYIYILILKSFIYFNLAALGLSCCMQDLAPCPGIEPRPPALGVQSLSHWTTREVPENEIYLIWLVFKFHNYGNLSIGTNSFRFRLNQKLKTLDFRECTLCFIFSTFIFWDNCRFICNYKKQSRDPVYPSFRYNYETLHSYITVKPYHS